MVFEEHGNWVTVVTFHPDGQRAASSSNNQFIRIWNTQTGELNQSFGEGGGQLRSLAFSPDGHFLLAGATDARLFNLDTLELVFTAAEYTDRINSVAFSHNGSMLATGSGDGTIRVWDSSTGETLRQFVGHSGQVRSVAFDANDAILLSSSADASLRLWNIESGLEVRIFEGHDVWVNQAVFTPDGRFAISGSWDNTLKLWHIHQVEELVEWTRANRYVRDLTCNEQNIYPVTRDPCEQ